MAFVAGVAAFLVWRGRKKEPSVVARSLPVRPPPTQEDAEDNLGGAGGDAEDGAVDNGDGRSTPS